MELGISTWKELIEVFVWFAGAGSLLYAAYSYHASRKQLNFAVIVSCPERFQIIVPKLKSSDPTERQGAVKQYVDLCNEELFYFKHRYLPDEIVDEWLDGMIYYLPHFQDGKNVNCDNDFLNEIVENNMLHDYPRIKESFRVNRKFDLSNSEDRRNLIQIVKSNLRKSNHI